LPAGPDPKHAFSAPFFAVAMGGDPKPKTLALLAEDAEFPKNDANGKGGLLGRPVKLVYYDDQSNPATNADLPAGASPPVSAMLKPIVIGSSVRPAAGEASAAIIAAATESWIPLKKPMPSSLLGACLHHRYPRSPENQSGEADRQSGRGERYRSLRAAPSPRRPSPSINVMR
jgi:hypothetical protein